MNTDAFWQCCRCSEQVNSTWYGNECPACSHMKCDYCYNIDMKPPPRPRERAQTMSSHPSIGDSGPEFPLVDCSCGCETCTCQPPPRPPPRPVTKP
ncbi:hypothetical protein DL95DRAFT_391974 [Leptodontidium sp. 2 PMI_412]|nr:hypothetical protein DL95DRAFT_391974 [Leptodontidium sp. 2 PMI_412]